MSTNPDVHPNVVAALLEHSRQLRKRSNASAQIVLNRGLRDRATGVKSVLAAGALRGGTWASVSDVARDPVSSDVQLLESDSAPWWRALGRIALSQAERVEDEELAFSFFSVADRIDGHESLSMGEYLAILQAAWDTQKYDAFAELQDAPSSLAAIELEFIALDLIAAEDGADSENWLVEFNARVLTRGKLAPIYFQPAGRTLYDRLASDAPATTIEGPLVTVVMTTFRRHDEILTSVRSILKQSWTNLELIIIDDASGPEFDLLLREVEGLDERIRVIRQVENSGTYMCRNKALSEARGEFVTFQDDDDWSHPQRLERQVMPLLLNDRIHSTLSHCVRATEDLHFRYSAVKSSRMNSSSLMFRHRDLVTLGGFDTVRKGGDSEFIQRLCEQLPGEQAIITDILAIVRLTTGSLSRTDFAAGWNHPSRAEYWEAAKWWHDQLACGAGDVVDTSGKTRSFPAPRRFISAAQAEGMRSKYDVVLLGDFSTNSPWTSWAWNQLQLRREHPGTVGIIHLNTPARPSGRPPRIMPEVRALIHSGEVERILPTDVVSVGTLVVCDVAILEMQEQSRWSLSCENATVLAETPPAESSERSFWSVRDVSVSAESMFGVTSITWVAGDVEVQASLLAHGLDVQSNRADFFLYKEKISVACRYPSTIPVVGRCAPELVGGWPSDVEDLKRVYPFDGRADVRIFGSTRTFHDAGWSEPSRWLWYDHEKYQYSNFVQQLDFYIHFGEEAPSTSEVRAILAVMLAGRVVVIDEKFDYLFGEAAVSCSIDDLEATIGRFHRDSEIYSTQVGLAARMVENRLGAGIDLSAQADRATNQSDNSASAMLRSPYHS
jgi:hypothetical protein